jgi:hypothetical protein
MCPHNDKFDEDSVKLSKFIFERLLTIFISNCSDSKNTQENPEDKSKFDFAKLKEAVMKSGMAENDERAEAKAYEFFRLRICGEYECSREQKSQIRTKKLGWLEYAKLIFKKLTDKSEMKSKMEKLFSIVHEGSSDNKNIDEININDMSCIVKKGMEMRNIGKWIKYNPFQY